MFDIGWSELLVIGVIALLVVGPKELPGLLRSIGQYVGKARSIARDFQRSMEDAAREADISSFKELRDAKREFDSMSRLDVTEQAKRTSNSLMSGGKTSSGAAASSGNGAATHAPDTAAAGPAPAPKPDPEPAKPAPSTGTAASAPQREAGTADDA